ncbi:MAG: EpsI family protein, partial [Bdellovibrionales bacterium]|nr:EpsI family protein [Bdellovibrionales bacterium]
LCIMGGSSGLYALYRFGAHQPTQADVYVEQLPFTIGTWKGEETEGLGVRSREILQLDRFVRRMYRSDEKPPLFLYVGYWKQQNGEHQAAKHSPSVCLPSNGWTVSDKAHVELELASGAKLKVNRLVGSIEGQQSLFYYWFFSGEKTYWEEWQALVHLSLEKFLHGRSDGGLVEISIPLPRGGDRQAAIEDAQQTLKGFIDQLYPDLSYLIARPSAPSP